MERNRLIDVKIIVATHKKVKMPQDNSLYLPIHVGREGKSDIGFIGDNTGDNISSLNPYYCELTGLYWAWKNLDCDYLGLVHYRRYYIETLYSDYAHTLDGSHLDIARDVIKELSPEYLTTFDKVMKQRSGYMFNMFIMKKDSANQYFSWLFPILDKMYEQIDVSQLTPFEARLFGRVSELLFNVWLKHKDIKPKELPFMYMEKVDLFEKGKSFLMAKFFGKKYGQSF